MVFLHSQVQVCEPWHPQPVFALIGTSDGKTTYWKIMSRLIVDLECIFKSSDFSTSWDIGLLSNLSVIVNGGGEHGSLGRTIVLMVAWTSLRVLLCG